MFSDLTRDEGQDEIDGSTTQWWWPGPEIWGREGCWPGVGTQDAGAETTEPT